MNQTTQKTLSAFDSEALFDALRNRMRQLTRQAAAVGSIGAVHKLLQETFEAGRATGRAEQQAQFAVRVRGILDDATARMPDSMPPGTDPDTPPDHADPKDAAIYWRTGRQQLWQLVEQERKRAYDEADELAHAQDKQRRWVEMRSSEVLRPAPSLRARIGMRLLSVSERLTSRGAS